MARKANMHWCRSLRGAVLLAAISLASLLSGCWSAREIEDLAFVMAMGVDTDPQGVRITYQLALSAPGGGEPGAGGGAQSPVWVTSLAAPSIAEAMLRLPTVLGQEPFTGHTLAVVVGEAYAREGIGELLDFLARDRQLRDRVRLAVAFGTAEEVMKAEPRIEAMPAEYLFNLLMQGQETGVVPPSGFLGVRIAFANRPLMQIALPALQPAPMPVEERNGEAAAGETKPSEVIELKGTAVFRDDRLVGFLDERESRGVAWLKENMRMTAVSIRRVEGTITQLANFSSARFSVREVDGAIRLHARVSQDGNLTQWPHYGQGITHAFLKQIEQDLASEVAAEVRAALAALQGEFNADTIGLGEELRRLRPQYVGLLNWNESFRELEVDIEVHAAFRRVGLTIR